MKHKVNNKVGRGNCQQSTAWEQGLEHGQDSGRFLSNISDRQVCWVQNLVYRMRK